jgi:mRNA interferase MazF
VGGGGGQAAPGARLHAERGHPGAPHTVVAPVTRTVRGIPSELSLGRDEGLEVECAASFDSLQTVPRIALTQRIGALDGVRRFEMCAALRAMSDC